MIGPKSTCPIPGPRRLTSWAWKCPASLAYLRISSGTDAPLLAALGLHIHVQLEMRMPDCLHQFATLLAGVDEVGIVRAPAAQSTDRRPPHRSPASRAEDSSTA